MITGNEILKELQTIKKKTEFAEVTYPNNDIWSEVNNKLKDIILLLKNDKRMFRYD